MATIADRLARAAQHVRSLGFCPAYIALYGSQNYGLALEGDGYLSDYDYKCVVLPSLRELAQESPCASLTVDFEGGQIDIKDVRLFARQMEKMNPAYLECLMTEHHLALDERQSMEAMRALLPALFAQRGAAFARVCAGLFEEKVKHLCHDSPAQAENISRYGYDLKQAHHMYRLLVTLRDFARTGEMHLLPPDDEREMLLDLKRGRYSLAEVTEMTGAWRTEIHALRAQIAAARGEDGDEAAAQLARIRTDMVYAHCRREVLDDGKI